MMLQYSPNAGLLYVALRQGEVAETAELRDDVYVDLDAAGRPLGIEFVNAWAFFSVPRRFGGNRR